MEIIINQKQQANSNSGKITCGTKCRMRFGENCFWAQMCQIRLHTFSR